MAFPGNCALTAAVLQLHSGLSWLSVQNNRRLLAMPGDCFGTIKYHQVNMHAQIDPRIASNRS